MRIAVLLATVAASLAFADAAAAGLATIRSRDLATPAATGAVRTVAGRFDLVGVRWRGSGGVELRTRSLTGAWSPWRPAAPEQEDGPDSGSAEDGNGGWHRGSPWWAGASDRLQLRTSGSVSRLRVFAVRSPAQLVPLRRASVAAQPAIVPRSVWGADESIRRGETTYAPELRFAVVHHTAGASTYTRAEAAAIVRGIQVYHVQANGWNDIGYNFLVDRFGTVYEGRFGGVDANVVGAHAQGFNTGSTGVAVLGTYGASAASSAAESAVARLLAWRLDLAHVDPLSTPTVVSGGSPKHAAGIPVVLRAVSGHRDVGATECPGTALYGRLATVAGAAARTGLPKLYEPTVDAADPAAVAFRARLSATMPWRVSITDGTGASVASGNGTGERVDWTWDSTAVPPGAYRWLIEAGNGGGAVAPASGEIAAGAAPPLAIEDAVVDPAVISPNGDGYADVGTVRFRLASAGTVSLTILDALGMPVGEVEPARWRRAGDHSVALDAAGLADGPYTLDLVGRSAAGEEARATAAFAVTRTLSAATLAPRTISANADGRADVLRVAFTLTRPARVRLLVVRGASVVTTAWRGQLAAGRQAVRWDGRKPSGVVQDGAFVMAIEADDGIAVARAELPFAADRTAPVVELVSRDPLRLKVTEPVALRVEVDGVVQRLSATRPGIVRVPAPRAPLRLRVQAWDGAGNAAQPLSATWPAGHAQ